MARAFLTGLLSGGAVAALGVSAVSLLAPPPVTPSVAAVAPTEADVDIKIPATSGQAPAPQESNPVKTVTNQVEVPKADDPVIETTEAKRPEVGAVANLDAGSAPDSAESGVAPQVAQSQPNKPAPAATLAELEDEVAPSVEVTPPARVAKTEAPQTDVDGGTAPDAIAEPSVRAGNDSTAPTLSAPQSLPRPSAVQNNDERLAALVRIPAEPPVRSDAARPVPEEDETPADDSAAVQEDAAPATAEPVEDTQSATVEDTEADRPTIGRPATNLVDRDETASSLPRVITPRPAITLTDPEPTDNAEAGDGSALMANKVAFENDAERPLMTIILMDTGDLEDEAPVGLAALGTFPYPLTFAIDATLPDAAERAARYRAEGLEVMALVDLPSNLTGADTEIALTAALDAVPGAVAVMEGAKSGLQGNRSMSDQVSSIAKGSGHGVVWQPNGLDTAQKLAAKEGVASQTLFRDFDSKDQSPTIIRRFLDQAAFKAGQEGSVIMVGRLRADTISALLVWGLQTRVQRVSVAPVSAVLLAGQSG